MKSFSKRHRIFGDLMPSSFGDLIHGGAGRPRRRPAWRNAALERNRDPVDGPAAAVQPGRFARHCYRHCCCCSYCIRVVFARISFCCTDQKLLCKSVLYARGGYPPGGSPFPCKYLYYYMLYKIFINIYYYYLLLLLPSCAAHAFSCDAQKHNNTLLLSCNTRVQTAGAPAQAAAARNQSSTRPPPCIIIHTNVII